MKSLIAKLVVVCFALLAHPSFAKEVNASLDLSKGSVSKNQKLIQVKKDDFIVLKVSSDMPGEFHLHAYQLALKLLPNDPQILRFKAYATGRFQFEWHPAADTAPITTHRHGPLASLEVFPN